MKLLTSVQEYLDFVLFRGVASGQKPFAVMSRISTGIILCTLAMYASRAKHASRGIHERDDKRAIWLEMGCYVGKKRVHRLIGEIVHTKVTECDVK